MGWDGNVLTAPFTKIAANGSGDLQQALGTSVMNQIALCTHANINPLSYHKPTAYEGITDGGSTAQAEYSDSLDPDRTAWSINKGTAFLADSSYGSSDIGTLKRMSYSVGLSTDKWTLIRPTVVFRAMDFDGYIPSGKLAYPLTCSGIPYDIAVDYGLSRTGDYADRPEFVMEMRFSFADAYGEALPRNAHLLGLKNLLNERDTSYTNLDVREGFYVFANVRQGRPDGLCFLYLSGYNLVNARDTGVIGANVRASEAIVSSRSTDAGTKILLGETVWITPFIAKRYTFNSTTGWLMYSLCAEASIKWEVTFNERTQRSAYINRSGSSIKYTAQVMQDGRLAFYINQASDVNIYLVGHNAVFSTKPITVAATGSHVKACTPAIITLGTQLFTGGWWDFSAPSTAQPSYMINAADFNGWSTGTSPLNRAGTFYVRRSDVSGSITVNALITTVTGGKTLTGTIPANIQTGGTITLSD